MKQKMQLQEVRSDSTGETSSDVGTSDTPMIYRKIMDRPLLEENIAIPNHGAVNQGIEDPSGEFSEQVATEPVKRHSVVDKIKATTLDALLAERQVEHPTTNCETMMHILKGNIGTGILAMPEALKNSGLAFGTIGVMLIGIICVHCMHILVRCARALYIRTGATALDYMDVAEISFKTGPPPLRKFSKAFRMITITFLCVTQMGFCCVYLLFVASNIQQVMECHIGEHSYRIYMSILLPILILLNFIRNLKYLAPASTIANALQLLSLGFLFYFLLDDLPDVKNRKQFATWGQLPLWFGTAIYSFEGISLVLPLENNMKIPQDFGGWSGVLNTSMVIVTCLYAGVGFFGYLKYGENVLGSVSLNLRGNWIGQLVRMSYAIAIFLTYALQFYVPVEIIWPFLKKYIKNVRYHLYAELAFRTFLVLVTFAIAASVSNLGPMISLVGALSGSFLTVICPPILEAVTFWSEGLSRWTLLKDVFIIIFGILGFITGTYASIYVIVSGDDSSSSNSTLICS